MAKSVAITCFPISTSYSPTNSLSLSLSLTNQNLCFHVDQPKADLYYILLVFLSSKWLIVSRFPLSNVCGSRSMWNWIPLKGTVQQKLTGVESDINRKVFLIALNR